MLGPCAGSSTSAFTTRRSLTAVELKSAGAPPTAGDRLIGTPDDLAARHWHPFRMASLTDAPKVAPDQTNPAIAPGA